MTLRVIPAQCIDVVWGSVEPLLQKAVSRSQNDFSVEDIRYHLTERNMQLWVWLEGSKITACCVSQIVIYPQKKICQLPFIAGKSSKMWLHCEDEIIKWAKEQGCVQLEGFCRDGWLKILHPRNWFKVWITMRKDI